MGLLDAVFGRTKPVPPNLDNLFTLPEAALTLQSSAGLVFTGNAGICWSPPSGQNQADVTKEIADLLALPDEASDPGTLTTRVDASTITQSVDSFGYRWLLIEERAVDVLVARVHLANSTIDEAGYGPQLLCSVFALGPEPGASDDAKSCYLIYLFKRGTFYPFAPSGNQTRDTQYELRLRSILSEDVAIEPDLSRWFPVWDVPIG